MNTTIIEYSGYAFEIPGKLSKPFRVLSTVLNGQEYEGPVSILDNSVVIDLVNNCNYRVIAAIGKHFAHRKEIDDVLACWQNLTEFGKIVAIYAAAKNSKPINILS